VRFGEVLLDRTWVPTIEDHLAVVDAFNDCGVETDFMALPDRVGNLEGADLSCLLEGLENADERAQSSARTFSEMGAPKPVIAGDFVAFLFSASACGIESLGIPEGEEIDDAAAMCIVDMVDRAVYADGLGAALPVLDQALADSASCFAESP